MNNATYSMVQVALAMVVEKSVVGDLGSGGAGAAVVATNLVGVLAVTTIILHTTGSVDPVLHHHYQTLSPSSSSLSSLLPSVSER